MPSYPLTLLPLYYRLRQLDLGGTSAYSPVRTVALGGAGLRLFPNPAPGGVATLLGAQPGTLVQMLDALGRPVATVTADAAGTARLALPAGLASGVYIMPGPRRCASPLSNGGPRTGTRKGQAMWPAPFCFSVVADARPPYST